MIVSGKAIFFKLCDEKYLSPSVKFYLSPDEHYRSGRLTAEKADDEPPLIAKESPYKYFA